MADAMLVGALVRVLPPFEETTDTVIAVQHVATDGTFADEPTGVVQYVLASGSAFAAEYVEAVA